jgi:oligopeptide transport system substrate-binding protein
MLRRKTPAIAVALVSALAVAACGSSSSGGSKGTGGGGGNGSVDLAKLPATPVDTRTGKSGGTFRLTIVEPTAIDPYNSQESEGQLVTKNIFDTLVTVQPERPSSSSRRPTTPTRPAAPGPST